MLIELVGGPVDGELREAGALPSQELRVPIGPAPEFFPNDLRAWTREPGYIEARYLLTVRPHSSGRGMIWVYVFADAYQGITARWR